MSPLVFPQSDPIARFPSVSATPVRCTPSYSTAGIRPSVSSAAVPPPLQALIRSYLNPTMVIEISPPGL